MEVRRLVVSFDYVAETYDKTRGYPISVMDKIIRTLVNELQGYVKILEVGVGTARFSKPLQKNGFDVVGVDVSLKMLRKAVEKGMRNLLVSSVCSLPFRSDSFDVTMSSGLLHLMKEWELTLQEIVRVTRNLMVSVIHRGESPASKEYRDLLAGYGWNIPQLGIAEHELGAIVKPVKLIDVTTYEASVGKSLTFLEWKAYSYQWDVPEEIQRQVIQQLMTRPLPKAYFVTIQVLIWDIDIICDFVKSRKD